MLLLLIFHRDPSRHGIWQTEIPAGRRRRRHCCLRKDLCISNSTWGSWVVSLRCTEMMRSLLMSSNGILKCQRKLLLRHVLFVKKIAIANHVYAWKLRLVKLFQSGPDGD